MKHRDVEQGSEPLDPRIMIMWHRCRELFVFVSEHETLVIQSSYMLGIEQKRFQVISLEEGPTNWDS